MPMRRLGQWCWLVSEGHVLGSDLGGYPAHVTARLLCWLMQVSRAPLFAGVTLVIPPMEMRILMDVLVLGTGACGMGCPEVCSLQRQIALVNLPVPW